MRMRRSDTMRAVDAVMPLVDEFNLLDDGDKLTFLDLVDPLPEKHGHRPKKKAGKRSSTSKASQSSTKSSRASGMAAQLSSRRQRQQINEGACTFVLEDGAICNTGDNNPIHDKSFGYAHCHPFQPSTTAPPAPAPSPANGGTSDESVSVVTGD